MPAAAASGEDCGAEFGHRLDKSDTAGDFDWRSGQGRGEGGRPGHDVYRQGQGRGRALSKLAGCTRWISMRSEPIAWPQIPGPGPAAHAS
jgi:hypothetical protein